MPIILLLSIGLLLTDCKSDSQKKSSIITEVYEVEDSANENFAKGALKYMEYENFVSNRKVEKLYYNKDQTVRGKEIYHYEVNSAQPSGSKYYDQSGALLSTYVFEYRDTLKVTAKAYEGDSDELLRIEGFQYDKKGNRVSKTIYNSFNEKQKTFLFGHDANGNETKMTLLDQNDKEILSESYEIVKVGERGEWLEKWGYLNASPTPVTFYIRRKSH